MPVHRSSQIPSTNNLLTMPLQNLLQNFEDREMLEIINAIQAPGLRPEKNIIVLGPLGNPYFGERNEDYYFSYICMNGARSVKVIGDSIRSLTANDLSIAFQHEVASARAEGIEHITLFIDVHGSRHIADSLETHKILVSDNPYREYYTLSLIKAALDNANNIPIDVILASCNAGTLNNEIERTKILDRFKSHASVLSLSSDKGFVNTFQLYSSAQNLKNTFSEKFLTSSEFLLPNRDIFPEARLSISSNFCLNLRSDRFLYQPILLSPFEMKLRKQILENVVSNNTIKNISKQSGKVTSKREIAQHTAHEVIPMLSFEAMEWINHNMKGGFPGLYSAKTAALLNVGGRMVVREFSGQTNNMSTISHDVVEFGLESGLKIGIHNVFKVRSPYMLTAEAGLLVAKLSAPYASQFNHYHQNLENSNALKHILWPVRDTSERVVMLASISHVIDNAKHIATNAILENPILTKPWSEKLLYFVNSFGCQDPLKNLSQQIMQKQPEHIETDKQTNNSSIEELVELSEQNGISSDSDNSKMENMVDAQKTDGYTPLSEKGQASKKSNTPIEVGFVVQRSNDGVFSGVSFTPSNSSFKYEIGFKFDQGTNDFVNTLLNRMLTARHVYDEFAFAGHTYGYEVKRTNSEAKINIFPVPGQHDQKISLEPVEMHFWSFLWKNSVKSEFYSETERQKLIKQRLLEGLTPYILQNYNNDVTNFLSNFNQHLAEGHLEEAKTLLENFNQTFVKHPATQNVYQESKQKYDFAEMVSHINTLINEDAPYKDMLNLIETFEQQYQGITSIREMTHDLRHQLNQYKEQIAIINIEQKLTKPKHNSIEKIYNAYKEKLSKLSPQQVQYLKGIATGLLHMYKEKFHPTVYGAMSCALQNFSYLSITGHIDDLLFPILPSSFHSELRENMSFINSQFLNPAIIGGTIGWYGAQFIDEPSAFAAKQIGRVLISPIVKPISNYYNNRFEKGNSPETSIGSWSEQTCHTAADPVKFGVATSICGLISTIPEPTTQIVVWTTAAIVSGYYSEVKKRDNIYHNIYFSLIKALGDSENFSKAQVKLAQAQKSYTERKLNLNLYAPVFSELKSSRDKNNDELIELYNIHTPESRLFSANYERVDFKNNQINGLQLPKRKPQNNLSLLFKSVDYYSYRMSLTQLKYLSRNLEQQLKQLAILETDYRVLSGQLDVLQGAVNPTDNNGIIIFGDLKNQNKVHAAAKAKMIRYQTRLSILTEQKVKQIQALPFYAFSYDLTAFSFKAMAYMAKFAQSCGLNAIQPPKFTWQEVASANGWPAPSTTNKQTSIWPFFTPTQRYLLNVESKKARFGWNQ